MSGFLTRDDFVVVDPGKNEVKTMIFSKSGDIKGVFTFPSKSKRVRGFNNNESSSPKQFRLELDKLKFLVGEGVPADYNSDITKNNEHHKLCVYASVGQLVQNDRESVRLVIGSPTNDFELSENVERYKQMVLGQRSGAIEMSIGGEQKSFYLEKLEVFPEGMAVLPRVMRKQTKKIHIIDIGGQNVNYRLYDEKGNTLQYFSLDYAGMNKLEQFLKTELRFSLSTNLIDIESIDWDTAISNSRIEEIEELIKTDSEKELLVGYTDTEDFVRTSIEQFIESEIITPLVRKGVHLQQRGHDILFTGGGSLRLEPYFKEMLPNNAENISVSVTAKWDNCISYAMRYLSQEESDKELVKKAVVKIIKEVKSPDFEEKHNFFELESPVLG